MTAISPPPVFSDAEPKVRRDNARALDSLEETLSPAPRDAKRSNAATRGTRRAGHLTSRTSLGALLGFAAVSVAAGAISGLINRKPRNKLWYRTLSKPTFTPPDRVFALVWPALYAGSAISGWRVFNAPASPERSRALALWGTQLAFNASWSPLFFGAHKPKLALVDLLGNLGSLGAYAYSAAKIDRSAAALVAPYLGWLGFAGVMNAGILTNNPRRF